MNLCACLVIQSCQTLCKPLDCSPPGFSVHGIFSGMNTGLGCHFFLQGIFQTQGWNWVSCVSSCIAGGFFTLCATGEVPPNTHTLFHILSHYGLSQDNEYGSLFCQVGRTFSFIHLLIIVCQRGDPNKHNKT